MISQTSKIFVSNKNYEYEEIDVWKIMEKFKNYFALSLNSKNNNYSFVPMENIKNEIYKGNIYNLVFENQQGCQYQLQVSDKCDFMTKRGYVNVNRINNLDVFIDKNDYLCKLTDKNIVENKTPEVMSDIIVQYTYNYFCNGILIRSGV